MTLVEVLRRGLFYLSLALAFIAVIAVLVAFSVKTGIQIRASWFAVGVWTPVIFWIVTTSTKRHWHRRSYWLILTGLLIVHLVSFVMVLRTYPELHPIWFAPISIVEGGLIGGFVEWCFLARTEQP